MDIFDCNDPLIINPTISAKIGLHETIVLRQIHYWLEMNKRDNRNFHDGFHWTFNSYPKWQEQFPFWSIPTIQRLFAKLEKYGLLISGKYNKLKMDRTKWYRINYEKLQTLINQPSYQSDTMEHINLIRPLHQLDTMDNIEMIRPIPETNSENTTEINEEITIPLSSQNKNENESMGNEPHASSIADQPATVESAVKYYFNVYRIKTHVEHPNLNSILMAQVRGALAKLITKGVNQEEMKHIIDVYCLEFGIQRITQFAEWIEKEVA